MSGVCRFAGGMWAGAAALVVAGSAWAQVVSRFDTGSDGWKAVGFSPTVHTGNPTGFTDAPFDSGDGRPPGSIRLADPYFWTFVAAPERYHGDFSALYGDSIGFDMVVRFADASGLYPVAALVGERITLYHSIEVSEITLHEWTAWSIDLAPGPWVVNNYQTGLPATEADIREVLADIRGFYIDTEYQTGPDDTSLDNIRFGQPGCYADCDESGSLDFFDFLCFQNTFAASEPYADCDGSGSHDFFDFLCFQNAFAAGCP